MSEEKNIEVKIEKVDIIEDEAPHKAENGRTWKEEFEMAGSELGDFLKKAFHEVTVRRVIVKNKNGRVLLDIPAAVGAIGLIPPLLLWTAGITAVAVLTNCSVTVVRDAKEEVETETEERAEEAPAV